VFSEELNVQFNDDFQALLQNCEKRLLASSCLSVLSAWNNPAVIRRIFIKFHFWIFFEKSVQKIQVSLQGDKNKGTLHEDQ
jgi:hypothetical protein